MHTKCWYGGGDAEVREINWEAAIEMDLGKMGCEDDAKQQALALAVLKLQIHYKRVS
jgi:hypothetical protein